jgi:hypothetical protein
VKVNRIAVWFQGKKTILVAVAVTAATVAGFWYGKLTPAQALQLVSVAGLAVGLGSKLQRYLPQILIGLEGLAVAIADLKAGQTVAAAKAIEGTAVRLAPAIEAGLHITGDPEHVGAILDALTHPPTNYIVHGSSQAPSTVTYAQPPAANS